ncbi:MAG: hypothetical protein B6I25_03470 [Planctomycetales bacterium 4572_13]|nr:MAG: hypothetical protein B6I25_03470 [Planctomycetales bacterium 4572_13]
MSEEKKQTANRSKVWDAGLVGILVGFVLCGIVMFTAMPSMMIVTKECQLGFDETVAALEKRIPEHGWVVSGGKAIDMNASLAKNGVEFGPRVKLVKLCNAEHAKSVLTTDRWVSCLMPCTMAVWEGDDGKVYLSEMNMGLMAKMFGGNIAKVMGGSVVHDEEQILEGLLKD